jgi:hypothetical protein
VSRQLRQDFLTDLVNDLSCLASTVFQIENDVVDFDCSQPFQKSDNEFTSGAKSEVNRLRRMIRIKGEVNIERLGEEA